MNLVELRLTARSAPILSGTIVISSTKVIRQFECVCWQSCNSRRLRWSCQPHGRRVHERSGADDGFPSRIHDSTPSWNRPCSIWFMPSNKLLDVEFGLLSPLHLLNGHRTTMGERLLRITNRRDNVDAAFIIAYNIIAPASYTSRGARLRVFSFLDFDSVVESDAIVQERLVETCLFIYMLGQIFG
jgi:hypothetical protein